MKRLLLIFLITVYLQQAHSVSYSETDAFRAFQYQKVSYCDESAIASWTCGKDCTDLSTIRDQQVYRDATYKTQAYTGYDSKFQRIVVAVRGTHNAKNWLENLDAIQVTYSNCKDCKVHRGMYQGYQSLQAFILKSVSELYNKYPSAKIWVVGHSLGGSLAGLAAIDIKRNGLTVDTFITFEQPRTGNSEFAEFIKQQFPQAIRITHHDDVVPHVPPLIFGYKHHGTEVFYNSAFSSYQVCDGSGSDSKCSAQYFFPTGIEDHTKLFNLFSGCYTESPYVKKVQSFVAKSAETVSVKKLLLARLEN